MCFVTSTSTVVVDDGLTCFYFRFHSVFLTKALLGFSLHVIQFECLFLVRIASKFSTQFEYVQDQPIEILFLFITFLLKTKKLDNFCHIKHSDGNFLVAGTEMTMNTYKCNTNNEDDGLKKIFDDFTLIRDLQITEATNFHKNIDKNFLE